MSLFVVEMILSTENYKMLMKETEDETDGKIHHVLERERHDIDIYRYIYICISLSLSLYIYIYTHTHTYNGTLTI